MDTQKSDKAAATSAGADTDGDRDINGGQGEASPARRRSATWLLGGLVLLLLSVLVALQVFGLWEVFTPERASDTLLLYALSSLNFAAFVVFTFIFVRNLLKLRRERRERQLGSKIKTRLVVYFIAVSLLPITGLAVFSYLFFNRAVDKWFSSLPEDVVSVAKQAQLNQSTERLGELRRDAAALAEIARDERLSNDTALLARLAREMDLDLLSITAGKQQQPLEPPPQAFEVAADNLSDETRRSILSAAPVGSETAEASAGGKVFDVYSTPLDFGRVLLLARERARDASLSNLVEGADRFENFKRRQRRVRLLGLSTLGLLTLLLLFAATWSAIHLARGIATPIRALAEAADEVARGNLSHRVGAVADDELAVLASSFNQMTEQLGENRERIEAGAAELREKNLALAERRDYIEAVLESLSTGVVSLDARDCVTTINAAAVSLLRLQGAAPAGQPLAELVGPEDFEVLRRVLRRARLRGRASEQVELARQGATENAEDGDGSGSVVPLALTATALGQQQTSERGVVLVMEDLSELLAAQRAAAWSEVARRMAHEIKNPLTPIQLSAERIARNFRRLRGEEGTAAGDHHPLRLNGHAEQERVARIVEESTATITREVAGLKSMVDEFARFARLPHARPEPADLNEIVRQAVALYEERTGVARLDVHLARTLPPALLDAEQMRRVLINLIDNALEALADVEGEQRVTVATGHDPARGLLLVEVADTGHGVARTDFPRLFQPYFSTRGRGTGLGLAIVRRVVADHGGRIRAEQNRPRGARFILELPAFDEVSRADN